MSCLKCDNAVEERLKVKESAHPNPFSHQTMSWIGPLHICDGAEGFGGLGYVYCAEKRVNEISWDGMARRSPDDAAERLAARNFWTSLRFSHFVHRRMQYQARYRPPFISSHEKHRKSTVIIKIYTPLPQRENKQHFSSLRTKTVVLSGTLRVYLKF